MIRALGFSAAATMIAVGGFVVPVQAQAQQGQQSAIGTASVRTREGSPSIQLTNAQTPLITVAFGPQQQQQDLKILALVSSPDQPQQDKEIVFNRAAAQHRIVAFEGDATGTQGRRLTLIADRGQENAIIEPIAQNEAVQVFGIRKAEPKVAQQPAAQPQAGQRSLLLHSNPRSRRRNSRRPPRRPRRKRRSARRRSRRRISTTRSSPCS
jgi:hypothetical protein